MDIFGIGAPEMLVIFVIALMVLGPQRLPEMARTVGKTIYEFRKVTGEATSVFREVMDVAQFEATTPTGTTEGPRTNTTGQVVGPDGLPYPVDNTGIHPMFRRDSSAVVDPDLLPDPPIPAVAASNGLADAAPTEAGAFLDYTAPGVLRIAPTQPAPALWYPQPGDPNAPPVQKPQTVAAGLDYPPPFG